VFFVFSPAFMFSTVFKLALLVFLTAKRKSPFGGGEPRQGRAKAKNNQLPTAFISIFMK
jgi:hypothetical protein